MTTKAPTLYDVVIIGDGLSGLSMALGLSYVAQQTDTDLKIALIGAGLSRENATTQSVSRDRRTTAIMSDSARHVQTWLEAHDANAWQDLAPQMAPLCTMRLINGAVVSDFKAADIDQEAFALNTPNAPLKQSLAACCHQSPLISCLATTATDITPTDLFPIIECEDGQSLQARLIIGADGHNGVTRQSFDIGVRHDSIDQAALVLNLAHSADHDNTSTEWHRAGGPVTFVPLSPEFVAQAYDKTNIDKTTAFASSLVWCDRPEVIETLARQPLTQTLADLESLTHNRYGDLKPLGKTSETPQIWPIRPYYADRLSASRMVLIGEAAHAIPPLAAQGFNLSLRDITTLIGIITSSLDLGLCIGGAHVTEAYARARRADTHGRYHATTWLNHLIAKESFTLPRLARAGQRLVDRVSPLRHRLMRWGMIPQQGDA